MTPDRQRPMLNVTPPKPAPGPQPTPADRLCASLLIARLNRVAHESDAAILDAAAVAIMELRHSVTKAAHAAFVEKQRRVDSRLRKAARAFLDDLRASGGPDEKAPDFSDEALAEKFVALIGDLSAALEAELPEPGEPDLSRP